MVARLVPDASSFDVFVTANVFGNILFDHVSEWLTAFGLAGKKVAVLRRRSVRWRCRSRGRVNVASDARAAHLQSGGRPPSRPLPTGPSSYPPHLLIVAIGFCGNATLPVNCTA
jgi:hypothetical protein